MTDESITTNNIFIYNRERAEITGVSDVISFSDENITFSCGFGTVSVDGESLKVLNFEGSGGKLSISGRIDNLTYFNDSAGSRPRRRFFS